VEGLSCLGADEASTKFDYKSFLAKEGPQIVSAAAEAIKKDDKAKPGEAAPSAAPSGGSEKGSWYTSPLFLIGVGVAVVGGGYLVLRK